MRAFHWVGLASMLTLLSCGGAVGSNKQKAKTGTIVSKQSIDPSCGDGDSAWSQANLTNFTSYPDPNSPECTQYNGCAYEGQFAFVDGVQTEDWAAAHNIIAVHSNDAN